MALEPQPEILLSPSRSGTQPDPAQCQHPDGKVRCEAAFTAAPKGSFVPLQLLPPPPAPARPMGSFDSPRVPLPGWFLGHSQPGCSPTSFRGSCWVSVTSWAPWDLRGVGAALPGVWQTGWWSFAPGLA